MQRACLAVTLALLCVLCGHDALMAAQGALPHAHHAGATAGPERVAPTSHDSPAPHPEPCDTLLQAMPQPTSAPSAAALPCVLPMRLELAASHERPVGLAAPLTRPPTARRAMLQVYRL